MKQFSTPCIIEVCWRKHKTVNAGGLAPLAGKEKENGIVARSNG